MAGGDSFGIGVTALLGFQRALGVTSNNVANVNTEGYSRQKIEFTNRTPQFSGVGYLGSGVVVSGISRIYDQALTDELRSASSLVGESNIMSRYSTNVNNLLASADAGIAPAMQSFFDAVNDVSNDPASIPARQVMLSEAEALTDRFSRFNNRFEQLSSDLNRELNTTVQEVNTLTSAIGRLNENIVKASGASGSLPNDLLDQRDQLLQKLSGYISIRVIEEQDGSANVFMGKGQLIVNRFSNQELTVVKNEFDPTIQELAFFQNGQLIDISKQVSGGVLGGLLQFREQILDPTQNALGRVALTFSTEFNAQHNLGIDLNGQFGQDFFSTSQPLVLGSDNNTGNIDMDVVVSDMTALTTNDYKLRYEGSDQYSILRQPDQQRTLIDASGGYPSSTTIDGITISINSPPAQGDVYLIQPTKRGAGNFSVLLEHADGIAAASAVRGEVSLANTGVVDLNGATVIDGSAFVADDYQVVFGLDSAASVGGPQGVPVDADADSADVLEYQLTINNVAIYAQGESSTSLASLDDLASAINAQVSATGVRAYVDNGSGQLFLANSPSSSRPVEVTESLVATSGVLESGDSVIGYFGATLDDATNSITQTFTASADSYLVVDSAGAAVVSGTYNAGENIDFNGIRIQASGTPNAGDLISIEQNFGGVGDNSNVLALSELRNKTTIGNGTTTYQEAYGQIVAGVGSSTRQAELSYKAQTSLLQSTQDERDSLSAVNLDEEAANMLRYQQAYQAAAQIISTADSMFQTLLSTIGR